MHQVGHRQLALCITRHEVKGLLLSPPPPAAAFLDLVET